MMKSTSGRKKSKLCMLEEDKICDNCLECNTCDVDPHKICDNCAKCIDSDADFKSIEIDDIVIEDELRKKLKLVDEQKPVPKH